MSLYNLAFCLSLSLSLSIRHFTFFFVTNKYLFVFMIKYLKKFWKLERKLNWKPTWEDRTIRRIADMYVFFLGRHVLPCELCSLRFGHHGPYRTTFVPLRNLSRRSLDLWSTQKYLEGSTIIIFEGSKLNHRAYM